MNSGPGADRGSGEARRAGLCASCANVKRIESPRGSTFYMCRLGVSDPRFEKYPILPVLSCPGHEEGSGET